MRRNALLIQAAKKELSGAWLFAAPFHSQCLVPVGQQLFSQADGLYCRCTCRCTKSLSLALLLPILPRISANGAFKDLASFLEISSISSFCLPPHFLSHALPLFPSALVTQASGREPSPAQQGTPDAAKEPVVFAWPPAQCRGKHGVTANRAGVVLPAEPSLARQDVLQKTRCIVDEKCKYGSCPFATLLWMAFELEIPFSFFQWEVD